MYHEMNKKKTPKEKKTSKNIVNTQEEQSNI